MSDDTRFCGWSGFFAVLGLVAAAIFAGLICKGNTPAALAALVLIPPFLFVSFERSVNKPDPDSGDDDSNNYYRPNLRIWGHGVVLGTGLSVLYLFARAVISSIDGPSLEISTSALAEVDSIRTEAADTSMAVADSTLVTLVGHSEGVASLILWHDGLLFFFLSAALAVVMYALVNVSRSQI